nr:hypothetical protein [Burkholderia singularis]
MSLPLRIDVLSIEQVRYAGDARLVAVPGESGDLGIYPLHTPLFACRAPWALDGCDCVCTHRPCKLLSSSYSSSESSTSLCRIA